MTMNKIIQERRKALGYTQEQIASFLGVSTPAVNKWEKGSTSPDITLLAPLARLLKTDVNTLLCFKEELSEQEVMVFLQEVNEGVKQFGLAKGFELAESKLKEYPKCDLLTYRLAILMDGFTMMSGNDDEIMVAYKEKIASWYESCMTSEIEEIRNGSLYLLASKAINNKQFEQAKKYVDQLPKWNDLDKEILEANLLLGLEQFDEAVILLQKKIQHLLMQFQNTMLKLLDAELASENIENAKKIAVIWKQIATLLSRPKYVYSVGELQVAIAVKDREESLRLLEVMLDSLKEKMTEKDSPIFYRLNKNKVDSNYEIFLPGIIKELKNNEQYDFLRESATFEALIKKYEPK